MRVRMLAERMRVWGPLASGLLPDTRAGVTIVVVVERYPAVITLALRSVHDVSSARRARASRIILTVYIATTLYIPTSPRAPGPSGPWSERPTDPARVSR